MPDGEISRWEKENDPLDRYVRQLTTELAVKPSEIAAIDARVHEEIDAATDVAEQSPMPEPTDALIGVYDDPKTVEPLWFRSGVKSAVEKNERAAGWGTFDG